ncbi:hypothetical protein AB4K20DRAFT_1886757 [Rhizopus microsporus]
MDTTLTQVSVIILQLCQGMYMCVYMQPEDKRMMLKGYLSTVYSYVGYALGVIATGYLISSNHDYTLLINPFLYTQVTKSLLDFFLKQASTCMN